VVVFHLILVSASTMRHGDSRASASWLFEGARLPSSNFLVSFWPKASPTALGLCWAGGVASHLCASLF
jgi:hypothetical protein